MLCYVILTYMYKEFAIQLYEHHLDLILRTCNSSCKT